MYFWTYPKIFFQRSYCLTTSGAWSNDFQSFSFILCPLIYMQYMYLHSSYFWHVSFTSKMYFWLLKYQLYFHSKNWLLKYFVELVWKELQLSVILTTLHPFRNRHEYIPLRTTSTNCSIIWWECRLHCWRPCLKHKYVF